MRLQQLFETPAEVTALGKMAEAIVQFVFGLVQSVSQEDPLDWKNVSWEDETTDWFEKHYKRTNHHLEPPRRKLKGDQATLDFWHTTMAYGEEYALGIGTKRRGTITQMLQGERGKPSTRAYETAQYELGTVGEILRIVKYAPTGLSASALAQLDNTWLILTDKEDNQGQSFGASRNGSDAAEEPDAGDMADDNARIEIGIRHFLRPNRMKLKWMTSIVAHELTHALDDANTQGMFHKKRDGTYKGVDKDNRQIRGDAYWKLNMEVNARFTQLAYEVKRMSERDPKFGEPAQRQALIKRLLTKHKLTTQFIDEDQYRQVIKRLTKYLEHDNAAA